VQQLSPQLRLLHCVSTDCQDLCRYPMAEACQTMYWPSPNLQAKAIRRRTSQCSSPLSPMTAPLFLRCKEHTRCESGNRVRKRPSIPTSKRLCTPSLPASDASRKIECRDTQTATDKSRPQLR